MKIFLLSIILFLPCFIDAQSYAFGIKGGPAAAMQRWSSFSNSDPLFQYHGIVFLETAPEDNKNIFIAQAGYHVRGRSVRFRTGVNPLNGNIIPARTFPIKFNNISLSLGGKSKVTLGSGFAYYLFGLRGEYNLSSELGIYNGLENGIAKFVYGVDVGGGFELPLSDLVAALVELRFSPDIGRQIFIPSFEFNNPYTGQRQSFREQSVRNLALEISIGFRFLHKIIYVN